MIRRLVAIPVAGGTRFFSVYAAPVASEAPAKVKAAAVTTEPPPAKFNPGDLVSWVDKKSVQHKIVPFEQNYHDKVYPMRYDKDWYDQIFGTVISFDEETKLVKVNFNQNGEAAYATGTWDVAEDMLRSCACPTIHDVPQMYTHDAKAFDTKVLQGKVVLMLDMEDRQMPSATCWIKLKRMYLKYKERGPKDEIAIMFFPHWNNNQPVEWFEKQLGLPFAEHNIFVMKKLACNGIHTQPVYQFLKQFFHGRVDWRYNQAYAKTGGWNSPKFLLDRNGKCVDKILGGSWSSASLRINEVMKKEPGADFTVPSIEFGGGTRSRAISMHEAVQRG